MEFNNAVILVKEIETIVFNPREKKFSSILSPSLGNLNFVKDELADCKVVLWQPMSPNYGALYPTSYSIYTFVCYAGTELYVLENPGATPVSYAMMLTFGIRPIPLPRRIIGLTYMDIKEKADETPEPVNP